MGRNTVELIIRAKDKASPELKNVSSNIAGLAPVAAKIAVGIVAGFTAAATAVFTLANSAAKAGDEIAKMSKRTGASTEFLSAMGFAAERSGSSIQEFEMGLRLAQRRLSDADRGLAEAKRTFDDLGISVRNNRGELKSTEELLPEVADRIAAMSDESKQAAIAQELFGRSGTKLLPLLKEGSAGIEKLKEEARKYGIVIDQEAAAESEEFRDSLTNLHASVSGLKLALARDLIPILTPLINKIADVVSELRGWIDQNESLIKQTAEIFSLYKRNEIEVLKDRLRELKGELAQTSDLFDAQTGVVLSNVEAGRSQEAILAEIAEAEARLKVLLAEQKGGQEEATAAAQQDVELRKKQVAEITRLEQETRDLIQAKKTLAAVEGISIAREEPEERPSLGTPTKETALGESAAFERKIAANRRMAEIKKQLIALGIQEKDVEAGLAGASVEQAELVLAAETKALEGRGAAHAGFIELLSAGVAKELETQQTLVEQTSDFIGSLIEQTAQGFGQAFADMIVAGEDFGESFKKLLKKILAEIISFLVVQIAKWAALTAAKALAGIPPGTPDAALAASLSSGGGGGGGGGLLSGIGRLFGFREGGIATKPIAGVFGEGGPEALIPLDRLFEVLRQPIAVHATFTGPVTGVEIDNAGERLGRALERGRRSALRRVS